VWCVVGTKFTRSEGNWNCWLEMIGLTREEFRENITIVRERMHVVVAPQTAQPALS
jgi:hypothetical protein